MDPRRWQKLEALFERALDLDGADREALLAAEPDQALAGEVRDLLAADASDSPLDQGALGAAEALAPGTIVAGYTIAEKLGAGSAGTVYRAVVERAERGQNTAAEPPEDRLSEAEPPDGAERGQNTAAEPPEDRLSEAEPPDGAERGQKTVAVKVLDTRGASDEAKKRFLNEARAASTIRHDGIVAVFAFGELDGGAPYYVMDLVDGPSLATHVLDGAPFSPAEVVAMLAPLAEALDAAHAHGVVHRDLKPANVMLAGGREPKLVDFGIAKLIDPPPGTDRLTKTGATIGTPAYMAPEQAQGRPVGPATDVYALGVMAFEMLTARRPFSAPTALETLYEHINTPPPAPSSVRPGLSPAIDDAVIAMLAKRPEERPTSARNAVAALAAARDLPALVASAPSRAPYVIGALLLLGAAVVILLALS